MNVGFNIYLYNLIQDQNSQDGNKYCGALFH
jgi:hypothetical protein